MKLRFSFLVVATLAALAGLWLLVKERPPSQERTTLTLLYAAGVRDPVMAIIEEYEAAYPGVDIEVHPSGSGQLMAKVLAGEKGDLFLAADSSFVDIAHDKGKIAERLPVAVQLPVLAVRNDSKYAIKDVNSLLEGTPRIGLGVPDGPAIGAVAKKILEKVGIWPQVKSAVETRGVFKPTVQELANDLKLGSIDVAILFDGTAAQYPELKAIPIPADINLPQKTTLGVLKSSEHPTQALHFARYLTAQDRGQKHFAKFGYTLGEADVWEDRPKVRLMCGGMLRPAVSDTLDEFERREGVSVERTFNGCGILVASLRAGGTKGTADAYFACDVSFMTSVSDLFLDPINLSQTTMVVAVPKGNPRAIKSLADLGRPGLRVGVANAKQSALGALTKAMLKREGLFDDVMKNVVTQLPTADMLITQLQGPKSTAGLLDAAIVYDVNARRAPGDVEIVTEGALTAPAVQPFAVAKTSKHKHLTARLLDALKGTDSRDRFVDQGFVWLPEKGGPERATK